MSNDTTENITQAPIVPTAPKRTRKKVNLATAKVADGEVKSPTNVYDIVGIPTHRYKTTSLASYSANLKAMNLIQLQEEAYNRAVLATESRDILIDRLERKFIQETSKFKTSSDGRSFEAQPVKEESLHDQALRILSRGR
jgi:hypothetical protein